LIFYVRRVDRDFWGFVSVGFDFRGGDVVRHLEETALAEDEGTVEVNLLQGEGVVVQRSVLLPV